MRSVVIKASMAVAGLALLGACTGIRDHRGHVIDRELASAIQVGVDNKDSVEKSLGRPTFVSQFDPNTWYYVSRDTKSVAFRDPAVLDQLALRIRFDAAGNVLAVQPTGREMIAAVDPDSAKTPTLGRERSFFDELFGNIGTIGSGGLGGSPQQP